MSAKGSASTSSSGPFDSVHRLDGEQRAEDLLAQQRRVGREAGGDRRRAEPAFARQVSRDRDQLAVAGGELAVPVDALLRLALDQRRHVGGEALRLAYDQRLRGSGEPLDELLGDRLVDQHPRGCRALLARVAEGGGDDRGDRVVEVGVGVDDHAVLAAHLGDHPLDVALRVRRLRRGPDDLEPDRARSGKRDQVHARVADEGGAGLAEAGEQSERLGGNAGGMKRLNQHQGAGGGLLGRLEHHRVACGERGRGHPGRDREREVPRRDHRRDPARHAAHRVALARDLYQLLAPLELHRSLRVVGEEVDRLADVGVGLRPRLRALPHFECGELWPAGPQDSGRGAQHLGALGGGPRPPGTGAPLRHLDRALGVGGGPGTGPRDQPLRVAGVGRLDPVPRAGVTADQDRHVERQPPVELGERLDQARASVGTPELQDRLVRECHGRRVPLTVRRAAPPAARRARGS